MDIDGLGGETVDLLRKEGLIENYADLCLFNLSIAFLCAIKKSVLPVFLEHLICSG